MRVTALTDSLIKKTSSRRKEYAIYTRDLENLYDALHFNESHELSKRRISREGLELIIHYFRACASKGSMLYEYSPLPIYDRQARLNKCYPLYQLTRYDGDSEPDNLNRLRYEMPDAEEPMMPLNIALTYIFSKSPSGREVEEVDRIFNADLVLDFRPSELQEIAEKIAKNDFVQLNKSGYERFSD